MFGLNTRDADYLRVSNVRVRRSIWRLLATRTVSERAARATVNIAIKAVFGFVAPLSVALLSICRSE